jgi:hypothetical protein
MTMTRKEQKILASSYLELRSTARLVMASFPLPTDYPADSREAYALGMLYAAMGIKLDFVKWEGEA